MTATLYGIPNCDTMKKARKWLDDHAIIYSFHDYKKAGIDEATLRAWVNELGWDVLLNKAGTTFRVLPDEAKLGLDQEKAIALMIANPSMIKRPVLDHDGSRTVGFQADIYEGLFS